jgi:hypothetical protein
MKKVAFFCGIASMLLSLGLLAKVIMAWPDVYGFYAFPFLGMCSALFYFRIWREKGDAE